MWRGRFTQLLFDVRLLRLLAENAEEGETEKRLREVEETLLSAVDPVDWTLAEGFMKVALEEYIASVALLISPLMMKGFDVDSTATTKALSKNANILFTPVEKLSSYPIATQSMQLMLQAKIKGMQWSVCLRKERIIKGRHDGLDDEPMHRGTFPNSPAAPFLTSIALQHELYDGILLC